MKGWQNIRQQDGRAPADRLALLNTYVHLDQSERKKLLKRNKLKSQHLSLWARAYYGEGLRELRRRQRLPAQ